MIDAPSFKINIFNTLLITKTKNKFINSFLENFLKKEGDIIYLTPKHGKDKVIIAGGYLWLMKELYKQLHNEDLSDHLISQTLCDNRKNKDTPLDENIKIRLNPITTYSSEFYKKENLEILKKSTEIIKYDNQGI